MYIEWRCRTINIGLYLYLRDYINSLPIQPYEAEYASGAVSGVPPLDLSAVAKLYYALS